MLGVSTFSSPASSPLSSSLFLVVLVSISCFTFTNSLGLRQNLRKQTIQTHTINDLLKIKKQMALLASVKSSGLDPEQFAHFALEQSAAEKGLSSPRFVQVDPIFKDDKFNQLESPLKSSNPQVPTTSKATNTIASFLPNTASIDSRSSPNFPSRCAPRPEKKKLTADDIACMTKHDATSHGRYTCPIRCPIGSPLSNDGKSCICGPCWEGTTCQTPKCAHDEVVGCPNHGTHCHHSERICLCNVVDGTPSYTGKHCENKFDPNAISKKEADEKEKEMIDEQVEEMKKQQAKEEIVCGGKTCDGVSMLNTTSCDCMCTPPWTGESCGTCPSCLSPLHSPDYNNNCQCSCNDKNITCQNEGYLNKDTCTCTCVNHFSGKDCSTCTPLTCKNDGEFNDDLCSCLCPKGWKGKTCNVCDETTACENGGAFNTDTCSCNCNIDGDEEEDTNNTTLTIKRENTFKTHWKGDFCETCPSSNFIDCGNFIFDQSTCKCTNQCEPIDCLHDSIVDPATCECKCNNGINITDSTVVKSYKQIKGVTFYTESDCGTCSPPSQGCPGGRTFNNANCTCDDACLNPPKCSASERGGDPESTTGDGILNPDTCTCDCAPGWGGVQCDQIADGSKQMLAAVSCQAAMTVIDEGPNGPAESGIYWINPSGTNFVENAFQVKCDMSTTGEGWTLLGNIDPNRPITVATYANGRDENNIKGLHVISCEKFHGLDGSDMELRNVVVKIVMGNVTDYYRPRNGATLCEMLQSNNQHQWWIGGGQDVEFKSPTKFPGADEQGIGDEEENVEEQSSFLQIEEEPDEIKNYEWITPTYEQDPKLQSLLGGSNRTWAMKYDGRAYLSFWGGDEAVNGGCCYDDSKWFRVGSCSSNLDIACFDDEECELNEETSSAKCVRKGGPRQIGWGKGFQIFLREVVLPGEGKAVGDAALDRQKELGNEEKDEQTSFLDAKDGNVGNVELDKFRALEEYNSGVL